MTRLLAVIAACASISCAWAWTQLSGGAGERCAGPGLRFDQLRDEGALRLRVTVVREGERQELTLHLDKEPDRLVAVGFHAFGAKQFEIVRTPGALRTRIQMGGLLVHPEALLRELERAYLVRNSQADPAESEVRVRPAGCGYEAIFRRLASSR